MDRRLTVFTAMGFELVGLVTVLVLIGRYLDNNYGWKGLGAGLGAFIGVMAWVFHLVLILRTLAKEDDPSHTDRQ